MGLSPFRRGFEIKTPNCRQIKCDIKATELLERGLEAGGLATAGTGGCFGRRTKNAVWHRSHFPQAWENSQVTLNYSSSGGEGCNKRERLRESRWESREQKQKGRGQTHPFPDRILPCPHGLWGKAGVWVGVWSAAWHWGFPVGAGTPYGVCYEAGAPLWGAIQDKAPLQRSALQTRAFSVGFHRERSFLYRIPNGAGAPLWSRGPIWAWGSSIDQDFPYRVPYGPGLPYGVL